MTRTTARVATRPVVVTPWTTAERMRKVRRLAGMNQTDFAAAIGVGREAYSSWEASTHDIQPRNIVTVARRIEDLTGVSASWILGLDETPPEGVSATERPYRVNHGCRGSAGRARRTLGRRRPCVTSRRSPYVSVT